MNLMLNLLEFPATSCRGIVLLNAATTYASTQGNAAPRRIDGKREPLIPAGALLDHVPNRKA